MSAKAARGSSQGDRSIDNELRGQPGLTSWFGELLTESYNEQRPTLTPDDFIELNFTQVVAGGVANDRTARCSNSRRWIKM